MTKNETRASGLNEVIFYHKYSVGIKLVAYSTLVFADYLRH